MSGGHVAIGRMQAGTVTINPVSVGNKQSKQVKIMKLTIKQRIRKWLMDDELEQARYVAVEQDRLGSEGMRLQIYKASGGFVVETRNYDYRKDESKYTMHVITDEEDLGERIGKIIMMETLRA